MCFVNRFFLEAWLVEVKGKARITRSRKTNFGVGVPTARRLQVRMTLLGVVLCRAEA